MSVDLAVVLLLVRRLLEDLAVDRQRDLAPLADVEVLLDVEAHHPARELLGDDHDGELLHAELGSRLEAVLAVDDHVLAVAFDDDERCDEADALDRRGELLQVRRTGLALVADDLEVAPSSRS